MVVCSEVLVQLHGVCVVRVCLWCAPPPLAHFLDGGDPLKNLKIRNVQKTTPNVKFEVGDRFFTKNWAGLGRGWNDQCLGNASKQR